MSLVVASGSHQGKVIPINSPQFTIGREAQCNLRPASQAISKKHCGIIVRDDNVFLVDYGSTNGTLVNDVLVRGEEVPVEDGTLVMVGPLDFRLRVEQEAGVETEAKDGTPFPTAGGREALDAVKAVAGDATMAPPPRSRDNTPNPGAKPQRDPTPNPAVLRPTPAKGRPGLPDDSKGGGTNLTGSKEAAALKAAPSAPKPAPKPPAPKPEAPTKITADAGDDDPDSIAAALLGMDDDDEVPDGSTVMEMPSVVAPDSKAGGKPGDDKGQKKATSREEMSTAANDILKKLLRRPK
ncbi:FHA domain-containing protein [Gemmata sp.]|uniref:FHA domain-containing protein n=1 Tax=Gemmata sp. TaxID=1914242 RepID=UPI003F6F4779